MKRTEIRQLFAAPESFDGAEVTVCGWVRTIRDSKAIGFIELNDGSAFKNLQIILETEKVSNFAEIVKLNVGSAICVRGRVILTPQAKQPLEVHADEVVLEGASTPDYPLQKSAIRWNFCARSRICVRAPIPLKRYSACGAWLRMLSTAFSTSADLSMRTRR